MNSAVKSIEHGSPASKSIISQGDVLCKINGNTISDVLDYQFHSYDSRLNIELLGIDGKVKLVSLAKPEGVDLGIEFDSFLMDKERVCENRCIFCFMEQLPGGMRSSLYYKDDDVRLSFLHGNYVSLTNLSSSDVERIIEYRISPVNVSVHTLDPKLRSFMLGGSRGGESLDILRMFAFSGITLNCQIVCCPGVNSGNALRKTIEGLIKLGSAVNSVSIVPVGLTRHRDGLYPLVPFARELAARTVRMVSHFARLCFRERGARVFFCADELYIMAGIDLPDDRRYEDYPQLENGVGMMRLFIAGFENALLACQSEALGYFSETTLGRSDCRQTCGFLPRGRALIQKNTPRPRSEGSPEHFEHFERVSVATGVLAYPFIKNLVDKVSEKCGTIDCEVFAIDNDFFGRGVTVSGLITGGDILAQLSGKNLGSKLLIPQNMLKHGQEIFLDDVTVAELSDRLGVDVLVVGQSGEDFFNALVQHI